MDTGLDVFQEKEKRKKEKKEEEWQRIKIIMSVTQRGDISL